MHIAPNQLLELQIDSHENAKSYQTRVEDAYDDLLIVGTPLEKGNLVPLRVGTLLKVEFKLRSTLKEGRFTNKAVVEKRFRTNIPLLQLRLLGEWTKTQERMFVRVPVFLDAIFNPLFQEQKGAEQTGLILNLSGGGFLLRSDYGLALQDLIEIFFKLGKEPITASAQVMRLVISTEQQDYGFCFLDLEEKTRQIIIQYVFKRQLELAEKTPEGRDSAELYAEE